jgi:hypothetical protein
MGICSPQEHRLKTGENVLIRSAAPDDVQALIVHRREIIEEGRQPQEVKLGPGQYVDGILMYRFVTSAAGVT